MDAGVGVAIRSLVASYDVPEQALSMVLFAACDSLDQALGGLLCGVALSIGGYPSIGLLVGAVRVVAAWMPLGSGRLMSVATSATEP